MEEENKRLNEENQSLKEMVATFQTDMNAIEEAMKALGKKKEGGSEKSSEERNKEDEATKDPTFHLSSSSQVPPKTNPKSKSRTVSAKFTRNPRTIIINPHTNQAEQHIDFDFTPPTSPKDRTPAHNNDDPRLQSLDSVLERLRTLELENRLVREGKRDLSGVLKGLCSFPDVDIPEGFTLPKFERYSGEGNSVAHLKGYLAKMTIARASKDLKVACFAESLTGAAGEWYNSQDTAFWSWADLTAAFIKQYDFHIQNVPSRAAVGKLRKGERETFRAFAIRWREQASRVFPPMSEAELSKVFFNCQTGNYSNYLHAHSGAPFNELVKRGIQIEESLKIGNLINMTAINDTIRVMQGGSNSWNKKKKEEVNNVTQSSIKRVKEDFPAPFNLSEPVKGEYVRNVNWKDKRQTFKDIGMPYDVAYERLLAAGKIQPIPAFEPKTNTAYYNVNAVCRYHSGMVGHHTRDCFNLKTKIGGMIDRKEITLTLPPKSQDVVLKDPLPKAEEANMVEFSSVYDEEVCLVNVVYEAEWEEAAILNFLGHKTKALTLAPGQAEEVNGPLPINSKLRGLMLMCWIQGQAHLPLISPMLGFQCN